MQFLEISSTNLKYFNQFWQIYEEAFPIFEKRDKKHQMRILSNEKYFAKALIDNQMVGLLCYWKIENFCFLEHFAIKKDKRGQNFGYKFLKEFCKNHKNIILEIDEIKDEISQKRFNFYQQFDFKINNVKHFQIPFSKSTPKVPLLLLSQNLLSTEEYLSIYKKMQETLI